VVAKKRGHAVYRVKSEKVSDLRKYYKKHTKTDRIDADTLAKIPLVDYDSLYEVELPQADLQALNRMVRQHEKLTTSIAIRKRRIQDLICFAVPLLLECFNDPFTLRATVILNRYFHPERVKRLGVKRLDKILLKNSDKPMEPFLAQRIYEAMMDAYLLYGEQEYIDFDELCNEVTFEMELMEHEEEVLQKLNKKIDALYVKLHPSRNLETIPGIGKILAPVFLANILNPDRFLTTEAFRGFTGMIPGKSESGLMEGKGGKMTKAGPTSLRRALYIAADVARQWDPQMAKFYYDHMVHKGNQHTKATCAVATKLASRILKVLKEDRPYVICDVDGEAMTKQQARQTIIEKWKVTEETRKRLRRKK
jgi:transposase